MFKSTLCLILLFSILSCKKTDTGDPSVPGDQPIENCTYSQSFTDARDAQSYPIVVIGKQTWMAKNLNYDIAGSSCHNCDAYGRLYNWTTALTVAPAGWHLPTPDEWAELINTLGGLDVAGGKMKHMKGWKTPNTDAINSVCFSALPGAYLSNDGRIIGSDENTAFWTTTEFDAETANVFVLGNQYGKIQKTNISKAWGLSVRCIKD